MAAITDALKKILPTIMTVAPYGGPLAAMAANAVGKILGVEVPATPEGIHDAITTAAAANPDIMLKLKEADQNFQLQMEQLGIKNVEDLEALAEKDRENARARQMTVRDKTPEILAYLLLILVGAFEGYALIHGVPENQTVASALNRLEDALMLMLAYYYGSSSSSRNKDATIHEVVTQNK